ncbi:MAG: efflux RND transporter periplasmic adaptor subunit [Proteobacteria bacterium]|nr:efflux RND transporter periplasmic adaptor subunit [Pseudomonadota bacterium]
MENLYSPKGTSYRKWVQLGVVVAVVGYGVWHYSGAKAAPKQGGAEMVIPVTVKTLKPEPVRAWTDFSGRLQPVDSAEIRPEVSGRIVSVNFQDGQQVKKGDVLFVIDPGPYEAAMARAEAALATAKSNAKFADIEQKRAASMVKTSAIPRRLYDERVNANQVAIDAIKSAEAQLKQARIDLDRAHVKAPISGRAGRVELTVGNVVQAGPTAPLLTTIVDNNAVYADFEVDEQHYLQSVRSTASARDVEQKIPVRLKIQGDEHPYEGTIYSFDNQLNLASGTIRARAKFENQDGALLPGMFVTVSLASATLENKMRVPEAAIGFDQDKKFVFTVDADNKVQYREVTLGDSANGFRTVLTGLEPGAKVIVDGVQHVRPGALVQPTEVGAAAPATAPNAVPNTAPKV